MPARKSDQPRKSDVLVPDDSTLATGPADESQGAASVPEKTPKDKDKEKDTTTIEVRSLSSAKWKQSKGGGSREITVQTAKVIQDLTLPKSIITRLAKGVLPPNTQIQANAILAMSKSATVFISYLASHANENTVNAGKKTVAPADVFKALDDVEFSFLKGPLEAEFARFSQIQTEKRTNYRQKARAKHDGTGGDDTEMADTTTAADATAASGTAGGAPRAKKARVDPGEVGDDGDEEEDAETEEEAEVHEEDDDDDDEQVDEEEEGEGEEGAEDANGSGGETQDVLEERTVSEDRDEALDGDESD
ncbi:histone-like transcription factor (CBF/NF-Y) family protein [Metarhizium robertsii]|uniref:DNA polymerase epsilon subunit D n=2 Tax=Metarhizium robertsii TaxID=568076 RepID=E9EV41_METRA|nr:DNA polymerase epsilon subunit D [Metarhizium robertsii ARSEF 23]EFZ00113.1 DNA polymerase epsilon subunit D [Metarhizium robertsii ARSEF 23]EXV02556.1 histone-like transcription factor (CBF/NF-Y) family protein [Metarhizium robertsii]